MFPCRLHKALRIGLVVAWLGILASFPLAADAPRPLFIEGYTGQVSYAPGDLLTLHASTSAHRFSVEIIRWGKDRERVSLVEDIEGREHPVVVRITHNLLARLSQ